MAPTARSPRRFTLSLDDTATAGTVLSSWNLLPLDSAYYSLRPSSVSAARTTQKRAVAELSVLQELEFGVERWGTWDMSVSTHNLSLSTYPPNVVLQPPQEDPGCGLRRLVTVRARRTLLWPATVLLREETHL